MDARSYGQVKEEHPSDLEIGARLFFSAEGVDAPLKGIFIGAEKGRFIAVRLFPGTTRFDPEELGQAGITVHYLFEKSVYEFDTRLIRVVPDPVELILLEYPASVRIRELRSHKRINCLVSANIQVKDRGLDAPLNGVIHDISRKGCRCIFGRAKDAGSIFRLNDEVVLTCRFPGTSGEHEAFGRVKNIQTEEDRVSVGIEFLDVPWWAPPYG